jgi:hypothetical protein
MEYLAFQPPRCNKQPAQGNRSPVALLGKVYCKVDADPAPVEVGDLLTTSETPGHAMKACDSTKAFGSVIGKAPRDEGNRPVESLRRSHRQSIATSSQWTGAHSYPHRTTVSRGGGP